MKVNVQAPNFAVKEDLLVFIEKRLQKLEQFKVLRTPIEKTKTKRALICLID